MSTRIDIWQVRSDGSVRPATCSMASGGFDEPSDLQSWIRQTPELLGEDLLIIGEQVTAGRTEDVGGRLDFLALDRNGDVVVVELKRDQIGRDALAQAIDYASDLANWDVERLDNVYREYRSRYGSDDMPESLGTALSERFEDTDVEALTLNGQQRILLVGTGLTAPLERMIEWLSSAFGVPVNAAIFSFARTEGGETLLAKMTVIPEEIERERTPGAGRRLRMTDTPGEYDDAELANQLWNYLSKRRKTPERIRNILLPLCVDNECVTREMLKAALVARGDTDDDGMAGTMVSTISRELGFEDNDYLRQVIRYGGAGTGHRYDYRLVPEYRELVIGVLRDLEDDSAEAEDS